MLHRVPPLAILDLRIRLTAGACPSAAGAAIRGQVVNAVTGRAVPTATVRLMPNQPDHGRVEADNAGVFWFDHVTEGKYSAEVEEQRYLKAVQAGVRVVLRRAAVNECALVRGIYTAGARNLASRGLHPDGPGIHDRGGSMATASS